MAGKITKMPNQPQPVMDRIGNAIGPGSLLYWSKADAIVQAVEVQPLTPPEKGKPPVAGHIVVMVQLQLRAPGPLTDFMVVLNPQDQERVEQAIAEFEKEPGPEDRVDLEKLREAAQPVEA